MDLDEHCGEHFRFRDLMECGPTWKKQRIDNSPASADTLAAIRALCAKVLDPVVNRFGPIEITFGFVSPELDRLIRQQPRPNTTRSRDQHAGCELNQRGTPYCRRLGIACDFRALEVGSRQVAAWIIAHTEYDRLYWYGDDRPIHVSVGPENARRRWAAPHSGGLGWLPTMEVPQSRSDR